MPGTRQVLLKIQCMFEKKKRFCTKGEKVHILSLHFNCSSMFMTLRFFLLQGCIEHLR